MFGSYRKKGKRSQVQTLTAQVKKLQRKADKKAKIAALKAKKEQLRKKLGM